MLKRNKYSRCRTTGAGTCKWGKVCCCLPHARTYTCMSLQPLRFTETLDSKLYASFSPRLSQNTNNFSTSHFRGGITSHGGMLWCQTSLKRLPINQQSNLPSALPRRLLHWSNGICLPRSPRQTSQRTGHLTPWHSRWQTSRVSCLMALVWQRVARLAKSGSSISVCPLSRTVGCVPERDLSVICVGPPGVTFHRPLKDQDPWPSILLMERFTQVWSVRLKIGARFLRQDHNFVDLGTFSWLARILSHSSKFEMQKDVQMCNVPFTRTYSCGWNPWFVADRWLEHWKKNPGQNIFT